MQYLVKATCEICGKEFANSVSHRSRVRRTCSQKCHRALIGEINGHPHKEFEPTPEYIQEMCALMRSGKLQIEGRNNFRLDLEDKHRSVVANTFVRCKDSKQSDSVEVDIYERNRK